MSLTLVTAPAVDPVSLAEAKAHLRITEADEDGLIAGYVLAARTHVEMHLSASLVTQTWDQVEDEFDDRIVLMNGPVQSITFVSYIDTDGATQVLASDQYRLVRTCEGFFAVAKAYGVSWPNARDIEGAVTVRFVSGYGSSPGSTPEQIRQAILLLIGHWYANREAVNVGNIVNELPLGVDALLAPYRVFY